MLLFLNMDKNVNDNKIFSYVYSDNDSRSAVNPLILDYYQKFGKKRDLEQFFSLSTAQSDIRDPSSLFWRKMKVSDESSDSGEGKGGSPTELCRISIKCTLPESSTSQDDCPRSKDDSESPPIITEEPIIPQQEEEDLTTHTDNDSLKSDDNNSRKSNDTHLDVSTNKPLSPTSSITSQKKLEWDSLGDVGYGNESERKASGSSLSTIERLALHQQYSNNDSKDNQYGAPTSHSTPVDVVNLNAGKRDNIKKKTKFHQKDADFVELNIPHMSDMKMGGINFNLTKHISFNVDKEGDITVTTPKESTNLFPNKVSVETEMTPYQGVDKEIQTSMLPAKTDMENSQTSKVKGNNSKREEKYPILISLNTLKKRARRKKFRVLKKKVCNKVKRKITTTSTSNVLPEKSGSQISEAESFEYMPGHMYNQNQIHGNISKNSNSVGNKSSLETSVIFTTDSSKSSKISFTRDLEKGVDLLRKTLQAKNKDSNLKEKLIKEVVQRLLTSKYGDDDNASAFLSSLSLNNKSTGIPYSVHTSTSTSDGHNAEKCNVMKKPKKSILRMDKFNPSGMASTSQSTPNLPTLVQSEHFLKAQKPSINSNTESEIESSKERNSSDTITRLSSEELYKKYLEALKREEVHKQLLKDKEALLKSKLLGSDSCLKGAPKTHDKSHERLYKLMKELAHNVDNGSGDANKLNLVSNSNTNNDNNIKKQRSHSVFTLTSGKSKRNSTKQLKRETVHAKQDTEAGTCQSNKNCCCCSNHSSNSFGENMCEVDDKPLKSQPFGHDRRPTDLPSRRHQVESNKSSPRRVDNVVIESEPDVQYLCLCPNRAVQEVPEKILIYKCSQISKQGTLVDTASKKSYSVGVQCSHDCLCSKRSKDIKLPTTDSTERIYINSDLNCANSSTSVRNPTRKESTASQTNTNFDLILGQEPQAKNAESSSSFKIYSPQMNCAVLGFKKPNSALQLQDEITRSAQTEISINPKISEPTLSDVKFLNDSDNTKQVESEQEEHIKTSNKSSLKNQSLKRKDSQISIGAREDQFNIDNNGNVLSDLKNSNALTQFAVHKLFSSENLPESTSNQGKFSIPIHGTTMTLVVTLGSNPANDIESGRVENVKPEETRNNQESSNDINRIQFEVDSKSIQCNSAEIFTPKDNFTNVIYSEEGKAKPSNIIHTNGKGNIFEDKTNIIASSSKYNTYPKSVPPAKKPLLRSNTDTNCLEALLTKDFINEKVNFETQRDLNVIPNNNNIDETPKESPKNLEKHVNAYRVLSQYNPKKSSGASKSGTDDEISNDPILNIIQGITKRYTKTDLGKSKRKKCFKEIISVLNYLLDTEESTERKDGSTSNSSSDRTLDKNQLRENEKKSANKKIFVNKGVQIATKDKKHTTCTESSDVPTSSELPTTTDSTTCKVLNRIRKECEKYHEKKCKPVHKKVEESSSTTGNCDKCSRHHQCSCKSKCRTHKLKSGEVKSKRKCVAYNLIIQTSDSIASEETITAEDRPLQDVVLKVPRKTKNLSKAPFKEVEAKIEKKLPHCSPLHDRLYRCRSLPNDSEMSSEDFGRKLRTCTVRDYLEMNRPDFVEKCAKRQTCLKMINQTRPGMMCTNPGYKMIVVHSPECKGSNFVGHCNTFYTGGPFSCNHCVEPIAQSICGEVTGIGLDKPIWCDICSKTFSAATNERANKRKLLSQQLERQHALNALTSDEIQQLARELGAQLRRKNVGPKFISEQEMKKHSEKIYKSLPEVLKKKEDLKKDNLKKTNLLMANIFKKNLQKKTLCGAVNLSNYSTVLKI